MACSYYRMERDIFCDIYKPIKKNDLCEDVCMVDVGLPEIDVEQEEAVAAYVATRYLEGGLDYDVLLPDSNKD